MSKPLSKRQQLFAAAYQKSLNATKAAIASGYSEKAARQQGTRLMANPSIKAVIEGKIAKRIAKFDIGADQILWEISKLAFFDARKLYNEDGSPKQLNELDDDTVACIAGLDVEEIFEGRGSNRVRVAVVKKWKLADKGINLERLGRFRKLFTDKFEHTGKDGGPIKHEASPIDPKKLTYEQLCQLEGIVRDGRAAKPAIDPSSQEPVPAAGLHSPNEA